MLKDYGNLKFMALTKCMTSKSVKKLEEYMDKLNNKVAISLAKTLPHIITDEMFVRNLNDDIMRKVLKFCKIVHSPVIHSYLYVYDDFLKIQNIDDIEMDLKRYLKINKFPSSMDNLSYEQSEEEFEQEVIESDFLWQLMVFCYINKYDLKKFKIMRDFYPYKKKGNLAFTFNFFKNSAFFEKAKTINYYKYSLELLFINLDDREMLDFLRGKLNIILNSEINKWNTQLMDLKAIEFLHEVETFLDIYKIFNQVENDFYKKHKNKEMVYRVFTTLVKSKDFLYGMNFSRDSVRRVSDFYRNLLEEDIKEEDIEYINKFILDNAISLDVFHHLKLIASSNNTSLLNTMKDKVIEDYFEYKDCKDFFIEYS